MLRGHTEGECWKQWRVRESSLRYEPSIVHPQVQTVSSMTWRWQRDGEPIKVIEGILSLVQLCFRDGVSGNNVDISDLSWEQREQVLRLLFAKMNTKKQPRHVLKSPRALPPIKTHTDDSQPTE